MYASIVPVKFKLYGIEFSIFHQKVSLTEEYKENAVLIILTVIFSKLKLQYR